MSFQWLGGMNYMAEEGEMADFVDELDEENFGDGRGEGGEVEPDEYDMVYSLLLLLLFIYLFIDYIFIYHLCVNCC